MGWLRAKVDHGNVKPIPIPTFPLKGKEQNRAVETPIGIRGKPLPALNDAPSR